MSALACCDSWFSSDRCPTEPLSAAAAWRRHEHRDSYTVVVGGFEEPKVLVDVINDFLAITFLDLLLRMRLTLHFEEMEPHRLFLTMASRRIFRPATPEMVARLQSGRKDPKHQWGQFLAEADRVLDGRTTIYKTDGTTFFRASRHGDSRIFEQPGPVVDVSGHWETYPEFGHYDHLLREDRPLLWGPGIHEV